MGKNSPVGVSTLWTGFDPLNAFAKGDYGPCHKLGSFAESGQQSYNATAICLNVEGTTVGIPFAAHLGVRFSS